MKLINFFELFKDTIFLFDARGTDGGKNKEMLSSLTAFGSCGYARFPEAFIFHLSNKQNLERKTVKFDSFYQIDEKYLNMDIIKVLKLELKGNWRTPANYYNNVCSLEIELTE
jgi:hypothetical protein